MITTKRAYEDLERDGFITTMVGRGSFVAESNMEILKEEQLRIVEQKLQEAVDQGEKAVLLWRKCRRYFLCCIRRMNDGVCN